MSSYMGNYHVLQSPKVTHQLRICEGYYIQFCDPHKKPSWFHCLMQRVFFGFVHSDLD